MDKKTKWILHILFFSTLIWSCCGIIMENSHNIKGIIFLASIIFISEALIIIFDNLGNSKKVYSIFVIIQSLSGIMLMFLDKSTSSQGLIFIVVGYAIIMYDSKKSIVISLLSYIIYAISRYYIVQVAVVDKMNYDRLLNFGINLFFMYIIFSFVKHQITQKEIINEKNKELQKAYDKLQESFDLMEENAVLRERNRIAGEIHDIVGHTLTTVLVEMEAAKRLINKDIDLSKEKLSSAQEQVRAGLNEIRASVKCISSGEKFKFTHILKTIISDTEKHAEVKVNADIKEIPKINDELEKILIRALQEGLTNGIKHSKSKNFNFKIESIDNNVSFYLYNDGLGTNDIKYGFGLTNIKNKIENLGGTLMVKSSANEGFSININVPNKFC